MAKRRTAWKVGPKVSKGGRRKRVQALLAAAVAAHRAGDLATAEAGYGNVLAISAENGEALRLLGTLHAQTGRTAEAIPLLERAVTADPGDDEAHNNLALALEAVGRIDEAETHLREALRLAPGEAERYANLGALLHDAGRSAEAAALLEEAAHRFPLHPGIHTNLGLAYEATRREAEAAAALTRAAALSPEAARVRRNLGLLLAKEGRLAAALPHLQAARRLGVADLELLLHLGSAHHAQGDMEAAASCFCIALERAPDSAMARSNLAAVLRDRGELSEAIALLEEAIDLDSTCAEAHGNLATCLNARGEQVEAGAADDRAVALRPKEPAFASRRLSRLVYRGDLSPEEVAAEHRAWGAAVAAATEPVARPAWDGAIGRSLRVGYVSPDLRRHAVATFLEPILSAHDPRAVEVICYSNAARPDAVSERLAALVSHWRDISTQDDDAAAAQVVADGVDLLVDLAGHTARHRLTLFARRPAPVQATYLGYAATTGLETMDYRITDGRLDPPGFEAHSSERLWRLPSGWICFRPPPEAPPVAPPPCLEAGHITFGSFNALAKVGREVVTLWAEVLGAVAGSRLLLKGAALGDAETRARLRDRFAACGIEPGRLELVGLTETAADHLALYHRVDIAVDPFPYAGCTTTCEALWMGVPVVSLAGDRAVARFGLSILSRVGLEALVAGDTHGYVEIAAALAGDRARLAALRSELRGRVAETLCDAGRFTRELEAAYRAMADTLWREGRR